MLPKILEFRRGQGTPCDPQRLPPSPARPGGGLLAVRQHHLIVVGEVLLHKVKGTDTEGLRNEARAEGGGSAEGHEESHCPHVVGLIVLLSSLPEQMVLTGETTMASGRLNPCWPFMSVMRAWTLDANTVPNLLKLFQKKKIHFIFN